MTKFHAHRPLALAFALAIATTLGAGQAAAECGQPGCAEKPESCEKAKEAGGCGCAGKAEAAGPAQQAYIDPQTGELGTPPAAGGSAAGDAPARAGGEAVAIPGGGGVQAELPAGYHADIVATKNEKGQIQAKCSHGGADHPAHE